jgi:hypothetical protein
MAIRSDFLGEIFDKELANEVMVSMSSEPTGSASSPLRIKSITRRPARSLTLSSGIGLSPNTSP